MFETTLPLCRLIGSVGASVELMEDDQLREVFSASRLLVLRETVKQCVFYYQGFLQRFTATQACRINYDVKKTKKNVLWGPSHHLTVTNKSSAGNPDYL